MRTVHLHSVRRNRPDPGHEVDLAPLGAAHLAASRRRQDCETQRQRPDAAGRHKPRPQVRQLLPWDRGVVLHLVALPRQSRLDAVERVGAGDVPGGPSPSQRSRPSAAGPGVRSRACVNQIGSRTGRRSAWPIVCTWRFPMRGKTCSLEPSEPLRHALRLRGRRQDARLEDVPGRLLEGRAAQLVLVALGDRIAALPGDQAQPAGFLASIRERHQRNRAEAEVSPMAVNHRAQLPRAGAAISDDEIEPVAVRVKAGRLGG